MRIRCTGCDSEVNLDHEVFKDYQGPVKCFCCGAIMDIKITGGLLDSIDSQDVLPELSVDLALERNL